MLSDLDVGLLIGLIVAGVIVIGAIIGYIIYKKKFAKIGDEAESSSAGDECDYIETLSHDPDTKRGGTTTSRGILSATDSEHVKTEAIKADLESDK